MPDLLRRLLEPRVAAGLILLAGGATILGALYVEHGVGLLPCKLCLQQRWPYYIGLPLAGLAIAAAWLGTRATARGALAFVALVFLAGAGLGAYHAGVEWGFWLGPNDCGGAAAPAMTGVGDLLKQLQTVRVVSCTEAAWRVLGISMAGWNA
ncbi:MAG TPA: disulfide bond formation protein B, partial [Salinarimonas sp.]|nr:disulfide bond formation protein B [Salinarimonas sp.]